MDDAIHRQNDFKHIVRKDRQTKTQAQVRTFVLIHTHLYTELHIYVYIHTHTCNNCHPLDYLSGNEITTVPVDVCVCACAIMEKIFNETLLVVLTNMKTTRMISLLIRMRIYEDGPEERQWRQ